MFLIIFVMIVVFVQVDVSVLFENVFQILSFQGIYVIYFNVDGIYVINIGISGIWQVQGLEICVVCLIGESGCVLFQDGVVLGDIWQGINVVIGEIVIYIIVLCES